MKAREMLFLFAIGAVGGLAGDAGNVQSHVTHYCCHEIVANATIWKSQWWFPILVGLGTVGMGDLRIRLGKLRAGFDPRIGVGAIAAVLAIYAVSSIGFGPQANDSVAKVLLCCAMAALVATFIADTPGVICGLAAAVAGPAVEILIVHHDWSFYSPSDDGLFGVALWLPPLYFAFGVAVARITELLVARRAP